MSPYNNRLCDNMNDTRENKKLYKKPKIKICGDVKKITKSGQDMEFSDEYKGTQPWPP